MFTFEGFILDVDIELTLRRDGHRDLNSVMLYTESSLDDLAQRMEALDDDDLA